MIDIAGCQDVGDMKRPWHEMKDGNVIFFDVISMHKISELFAIAQMCYSHYPERIVEYGTAMGGLTRLLGRWAYVTGAKVLSIDSSKWGYASRTDYKKHNELLERLPVELLDINESTQECYTKIQLFAEGYRTLYYCDGGNKPAEFRWCARILKPGDLLITHDYDLTKEDLAGITLFFFFFRGGENKTRLLAAQIRKDKENGSSNISDSDGSSEEFQNQK